MPRRPRVLIPGAAHHVTQRGNHRQPTFETDADRYLYLELLHEECARHGVRLLAWCLMTNHVHLVAVPDTEESLPAMIQRAHSRYSLLFNRHLERVGHLWQNRYYSCVLGGAHLYRAIAYIEMNPVRAGLSQTPWEWRWSSAAAHCNPRANDPILGRDWPQYFRYWDYEGWRESLAAKLSEGECDAIRRSTLLGEPLGSPEFLDALEKQLGRPVRVGERGRPAGKKASDPFNKGVGRVYELGAVLS